MSKQQFKIVYNRESEVLSVEMKKAKSVDSDIHGNVVIDYDRKGDVVRVNFYHFSFHAFTANAKQVKQFARRVKMPVFVR